MAEVTETMIYEMAFRVRLYIASKFSEDNRLNDLSEREALLLELVGTMGSLSISEIGNFYPKVSSSTISTTITKLWKDKKLVDKRILPENQRITTVNLTEKGHLIFRKAVEKALQDPSAIKKWYLSVIAGMARSIPIWSLSANGLQWCEVDFPADLKQARRVVRAIAEGDQQGGYRQKSYALG